MALFKRMGSLRRSHRAGAYSLPRRVEAKGMERSKGMVRCHITLLDDTVFTCDIDKHSHGDALLDEVFGHLDILERDYFGLAYMDDRVTKWVDAAKPLKKQFKGSHTLALEFRVKFYVTDPRKLQEEITRYQFFLQVKKDILTSKLTCSLESATILGAYMMQAELGDYDPQKHPPNYVSEFRLFPVAIQTEELEEKIAELHQSLRGRSTKEIEFQFLSYARRLEFYGVELFTARDHHGVELGLGITGNGIGVFKNRTAITTFSWLNVQKITYKRKKFYIELRPEQGGVTHNVVGFHLDTYDGCKQLWKNCIEYHAFFRMSEVKQPPKSRLKKSGYKYGGRTEQQAWEANKDVFRSDMIVKRTPSKRVARRSPGPGSGSEGDLHMVGGSAVRRVQSLKESSRPKLYLSRNIRALSEERDYELEDSSFSPEITISDDMTGQHQFSFLSLEETNHFSLNFKRMSNAHQGPQEYYDEQNAAEELAGQVCMDDLASEGLLLIRIEPDERGRFGFNVKGGADEKMPVIVTKVVPDSPAARCNPPVEEGDQVLYINGKSVAEQSHDNVIKMIRTSREQNPNEMVVIVKPRNLTRVIPSSESEAISQVADAGHMLRQSLTHLKESLANNSILSLQFDRLYRRKPGLAAIASKLPQNLVKNRYRDISAYDSTRVLLKEGHDYINANYVNMEVLATGQINKYIAAQGPMQHTCKDFWQMTWEERSTLIIMLTNVVEEGKVRCCRYWPDVSSSLEYGKYEVFNISEQSDRISITRQFRLRNNMTGEERRVVHMQYIDWPDHGIPGSKLDFIRFVQGVRTFREGMEAPVIVHCSAGIGRTGMFILMETALCKMEVLEPIYPLDIVRIMRDQRGMLVQTPIQYQFVCASILQSYEEDYVEIEIPSHSVVKTSLSYH